MVIYKDVSGKYKHRGHWLLLSRKKPRRVLRIYGTKKPSKAKVRKDEKRIMMFKHMRRY